MAVAERVRGRPGGLILPDATGTEAQDVPCIPYLEAVSCPAWLPDMSLKAFGRHAPDPWRAALHCQLSGASLESVKRQAAGEAPGAHPDV